MTTFEIPHEFQEILRPHLPFADSGELSGLDDLAGLGLDSMGVVRLMVDIENAYGVQVPDELLDERTFATVGSLWAAISPLVSGTRRA
jgi:acyl carrier protein